MTCQKCARNRRTDIIYNLMMSSSYTPPKKEKKNYVLVGNAKYLLILFSFLLLFLFQLGKIIVQPQIFKENSVWHKCLHVAICYFFQSMNRSPAASESSVFLIQMKISKPYLLPLRFRPRNLQFSKLLK